MNEIIGTGRTSKVYKFDNGKVVKLFNQNIADEIIQYEYTMTRMAHSLGCPAPEVFEIVQIQSKTGILLEQLTGKSVFDLIKREPLNVKCIAASAAKAHLRVHRRKAPQLIKQYDKYKPDIEQTTFLTEKEKEKTIRYLNHLPNESVMCHGDLHPDNIIVSQNDYYIIDWINAYSGSPASDMARSMLILESPFIKSLVPGWTYPLYNQLIKTYKNFYMKTYIRNSNVDYKEIKDWLLPIAASRLSENVPYEREWLLKIVRDELRKLQ